MSRRPLADVLDELRTAHTLTFDEHAPGIVVMSVNRPHRANSQTVEMFGELAWAAVTLRNAPLRALIITGAGGKAFCAGFDLDEVDVLTRMTVPEFTELIETAASGVHRAACAPLSRDRRCQWSRSGRRSVAGLGRRYPNRGPDGQFQRGLRADSGYPSASSAHRGT